MLTCSVRDQPDVWLWARSSRDFGFLGLNFSLTSVAHNLRAALILAISWKMQFHFMKKNNKQNIEEARKNYIINKWNFGIKAIYTYIRAETWRAAVFFPTILVFILDFKPEKKIIPCRSSFRFPRKMKDEERTCPHLALSLFLKDAQIKCEVS